LGAGRDENRDHMVMPGLVYISQPTEYDTLYSLEELAALRTACASTLTVRDLRMQ
jgi:threonine aldolase